VLGPSPDQSNLIVRQAPLVGKLTVSRFRFPWWHEATFRRAGDQLRTLCCIFISEQREWRYFAGTMAGRTMSIKKRRDMFVERRYIGCTRSHTEDDRCDEYRCDDHGVRALGGINITHFVADDTPPLRGGEIPSSARRGMNHYFNLSITASTFLQNSLAACPPLVARRKRHRVGPDSARRN